MQKPQSWVALATLGVCLLGCGSETVVVVSRTPTPTATPSPTAAPPDIVFIILDDVGIDQLQSFGLGEGDASTPNLDAIASAGVKFTNTWAMPECSPSRSAFFTGRLPLRTGVTSALIPNMLPQAQVSPYESTISRVLATAGYSSALVGKYHLGDTSPSRYCAPRTTGWDYFNGNMEAGPPAIDKQGGHVEPSAANDLVCGFDQGPQHGACYFDDAARCPGRTAPCCAIGTVAVPQPDGGTVSQPVTGRTCLEAGGLFVAGAQACESAAPISCTSDSGAAGTCLSIGEGQVVLDFSRHNGYYAWPDTLATGVLPPDATDFSDPACGAPPTSRDYMTIAQTDAAIDWYTAQTGPRMLSVSYNAIHTPYQQAPTSLVSRPDDDLQCGMEASDRLLSNYLLEAMDAEIGRLLAGLGLATLDEHGTIHTVTDDTGNPRIPGLESSNTMLVIVGDNGSFGFNVKLPFDAGKAKGTVYQTGVWVPLIVAGPLVAGPTGRSTDALVNVMDLYELFGEIAGLDVRIIVPPAHRLDSRPMLAYLTVPNQPSIRTYNVTQLGPGVFETPTNTQTRSWPCVLDGTQCNDFLLNTQEFCHTNGGVWWGPSDDPDPEVVSVLGADAAPQGLGSCCAVQTALEAQPTPPTDFLVQPLHQYAVRNATYKLIKLSYPACSDPQYDPNAFLPNITTDVYEFYDLTAGTGNPVGLDETNLACDPNGSADCFTDETLKANFVALKNEMTRVFSSEVACPGDGNLDKRVNDLDAQGVQAYAGQGQSFFDFNLDAETNAADLQIVTAHLGTDCLGPCPRSDLNRDGQVTDADAAILTSAYGPCDLCGSDIDGNGLVNDADLHILQDHQGCTP